MKKINNNNNIITRDGIHTLMENKKQNKKKPLVAGQSEQRYVARITKGSKP